MFFSAPTLHSACLGPIDEARDLEIDFETTRGEPLKPIVH